MSLESRERSRKKYYQYCKQRYDFIIFNSACKYCGSKRHLLFHHRDPTTKRYNLGRSLCISRLHFEQELEKCDVICRSCHQQIHMPGYRRKFVYPSVKKWKTYWRVRFYRDKKLCKLFKTKKEAIQFANNYALQLIGE